MKTNDQLEPNIFVIFGGAGGREVRPLAVVNRSRRVDRHKAWIAAKGISKPTDWIFTQDDDRTAPIVGFRRTEGIEEGGAGRGMRFPISPALVALVPARQHNAQCGRMSAGALERH